MASIVKEITLRAETTEGYVTVRMKPSDGAETFVSMEAVEGVLQDGKNLLLRGLQEKQEKADGRIPD